MLFEPPCGLFGDLDFFYYYFFLVEATAQSYSWNRNEIPITLMVVTNVATRGLDHQVAHVIQFDSPRDIDTLMRILKY